MSRVVQVLWPRSGRARSQLRQDVVQEQSEGPHVRNDVVDRHHGVEVLAPPHAIHPEQRARLKVEGLHRTGVQVGVDVLL